MGIKSLCAAAVLAIGVGQAEAATYTTVDYDLYLRYEGTGFDDFIAYDVRDLDNTYTSPYYPAEDPLGLNVSNQKFSGIAVGDIIRFIATIIFPDDPNQVVTQYGNGGSAPICSIGKTSCTNTEWSAYSPTNDSFDIRYSDEIRISGSTRIGSTLSYDHYYPGMWNSDDGNWLYYAWYTNAEFTVVQIVDTPAPVPLPATAALLPLGIGALAMIRRRRLKG